MKILTGLFHSIVFPRNHANVSEQTVTGTCRASGGVDPNTITNEGEEEMPVKVDTHSASFVEWDDWQ